MAFIDAHRGTFGVEPICEVLREHGVGIAPNTYHVAKKRPPSPRSVRDRELKIEIQRVFDENLFVYGADKIWDTAQPGEHSGCSVHGRTIDVPDGPVWRQTREDVHGHHHQR